MVSATVMSLALLAGLSLAQPNIVVIMTDDQDRLMNSADHMPVIQRELVDKGTTFTNHFTTTSNCCPGRATFLRGQSAHNTNITHVNAPGGNYDKWRRAGEDQEYLPHWLKAAGYQAEYVGKFFNGYNTANYDFIPRGWDHMDSLLDPFINDFNKPVFSANGERPILYQDYHQTDVVRVKSLDRLDHLLAQEAPFYIQIAPFAVHFSVEGPPTPCTRHNTSFLDVPAPRFDNWNPEDEAQSGKSTWMKDLPRLNETIEASLDIFHQRRLQSLLGVDEIVEDVIAKLEEAGVLDNTFIIFTTDNGYHIGAHRVPAGKGLPYIMDSNLPLYVRGPGVPEGATSRVVSAHVDMAPTILDIAELPQEQWPVFFDGRSLLSEWQQNPPPEAPTESGTGPEVLNIEFWADKLIEAPPHDYGGTVDLDKSSHKTIRIVSEASSWSYIKWCTGEQELYNTTADPWEVNNLARGDIEPEVQRVLDRLNAMLLASKSCTEGGCRNIWTIFQLPNVTSPITSLDRALDPEYDTFFAEFPAVSFGTCMRYQDEENEQPFYPEGAENGLGKAYRNPTDNFITLQPNGTEVPANAKHEGGPEQRHATLEEMNAKARELTDAELGLAPPDDQER